MRTSFNPSNRIGIDFDNTLVNYQDLFYKCALEHGWIESSFSADKTTIRDFLRKQPSGELRWMELQAQVYGERICEAMPFPGVLDFMHRASHCKIPLAIISHKSSHSAWGGKDLHQAARSFLQVHDIVGSALAPLSWNAVFFEPTRQAKIQRIQSWKCTHFVDDLKETFLEFEFPPIQRFLFQPSDVEFPPTQTEPWWRVASWQHLQDLLLYDSVP